VLAASALQISEFVGMPEARIPLAQAAVYIACAPKSNAAYLALEKAYTEVENETVQEVPDHLKDASYKAAASLGRGKDYKYSHDYPGHFIQQDYTRRKVRFYEPTDIGHEARIKQRLDKIRSGK
jgi:putative ATPase